VLALYRFEWVTNEGSSRSRQGTKSLRKAFCSYSFPHSNAFLALSASLREASFSLARSLHSLKPQRCRDTKIAKELSYSLSAYSAPSAVKAYASQGEENVK